MSWEIYSCYAFEQCSPWASHVRYSIPKLCNRFFRPNYNICIPLPEVVKNTFLVIQGTKSRPGIKAGVT